MSAQDFISAMFFTHVSLRFEVAAVTRWQHHSKLKRNLGHHGVWTTFLLVPGHSVLARAPSLDTALLVNINVTKMHANCGSRNARCSVDKVEIISLAFKWLIVLRSAIKTRDQTHRVLKMRMPRTTRREKHMCTRLTRRLIYIFSSLFDCLQLFLSC